MSSKSDTRRLSSLFVPPTTDNAAQPHSSSRLAALSKGISGALSGSASIASLREPLSPIRSFYGGLTGQAIPGSRKRSKQDFRSYDDATFEDEMNLPGSGGNGVRVWYESYTTIDWIHDAIKESSRLRRIRNLRGIRGFAINSWDRLQGWIIVTITGIVTALIAGCIVKSEAVLFDLKDGYCAKDWRLAKRFCCPYGNAPDWDHPDMASASASASWSYRTRFLPNAAIPTSPADALQSLVSGVGVGNRILSGWAAPVAGSPAWHRQPSFPSQHANASLSAMLSPVDSETEDCPGWISWGQKFGSTDSHNWAASYSMYLSSPSSGPPSPASSPSTSHPANSTSRTPPANRLPPPTSTKNLLLLPTATPVNTATALTRSPPRLPPSSQTPPPRQPSRSSALP